MNGVRDFDFVTMDDYAADMAANTQLGVNIIEAQKREIRDLKRTLWLVVLAAGGEVKVPDCDLRSVDLERSFLVSEYDPYLMTQNFRARIKSVQPDGGH